MTMFRTIAFAALAAFAIAYATAPAGSSATQACGGALVEIKDPGIRASFTAFEAQQSEAASRICATYRNAG